MFNIHHWDLSGKIALDDLAINDAWKKSIINLYVNNDGHSFITTETEKSCEDNICPNGESQTNGQDEAGLIKNIIF